MKRFATAALLVLFLVAGALNGYAQPYPERGDVIWARDIGAAEIALDGALDEAVWDQAEEINLMWEERAGFPGSGWRVHGQFSAPAATDPAQGTIKLLRQGNQLYVGATIQDLSVGGSTGLWNIDALVIAINDRATYEANVAGSRNFFPGNGVGEYIYGWWHQADTTAAGDPTPDATPRFHNNRGFGTPNNEVSKERTAEQIAAWDAVTVVDGTTNDDTHGDDNGYVVEMRIDLTEMGYDAEQPGGTTVAASFTIYDSDYQWPVDADRFITTKVWFESQWGNNLNEGAALVRMHPDVTVDTATLPDDTEPAFHIQAGAAPTIDGALDEATWQALPNVVEFGYQQTDVNNTLPDFGPWYTFWFRPDLNGADPDPDVLDPSVLRFKFYHNGSQLFIGADIDDQAISGRLGEGGDGFSITFNHADSLDGDNTPFQARYIFNIDSTGTVQMSGEAAVLAAENPDAISAAAAPKGASTPGDPTDVDTGYQIEIMLDLVEALGYDAALTENPYLWMGANLFDADEFEDTANDYSTRTWWLRERTTGPGATAYLDPADIGTAVEDETEVPERIALLGNYPNPFNPVTRLRYALPQTGEVTLKIFDVLGRRVAELTPGLQAAGINEFTFDASGFASGMYLYRLEVKNLSSDAVQASQVGRMVLIK